MGWQGLQMLLGAAGAPGDREGAGVWFPNQASTVAGDVDWLFFYIYWLCVIFFAIIVGATTLFVIKYRHRPGIKADTSLTHSTVLELGWSFLPGLLLVPMFYWGFTGYVDMRTPPAGAYNINVQAQKWNWDFAYPASGADFSTPELHVPVNTPVTLNMQSSDVIHSLFIPAFRVKQDVVPGRMNRMWFQATKEGTFNLFCTEYCGTKHSAMITKVIVHPQGSASTPGTFEHWLAEAIKQDEKMKLENPVKWGESLYNKLGCASCHNLDGKAGGIGPSFKIGADTGFGTTRKLTTGADQVMDEAYIIESILAPEKKVRAGYQPAMPSYKGRVNESQLKALTKFLEAQK